MDELTEVEGLMSMGKPLPKSSGFLALGEVSTSPYRYNFGEYILQGYSPKDSVFVETEIKVLKYFILENYYW